VLNKEVSKMIGKYLTMKEVQQMLKLSREEINEFPTEAISMA